MRKLTISFSKKLFSCINYLQLLKYITKQVTEYEITLNPLSMPPENIRQPLVFSCISENIEKD